MEGKYRLVIDTNIIIGAFISKDSYAAQLINKWFAEEFILLVSEETIKEAEDVLYRQRFIDKYKFSKQRISFLLSDMLSRGEHLEPYPLSIKSRDSKDTKFLHLAIVGSADYLVSADKDLLSLRNNPDIGALKIFSVEEMLDEL